MDKCADCGFLAARNIDTRNLDEVEREFRRSGEPPNQIMAGKEIGYPIHKRYPVCFVQEYDLLDLFEKINGDEYKRFLVVIDEERRCEPFTTWKQGFTPKEHQEMIDRQWKLDFEAKREQEDREWRASEEKDRREWQQKQSAKRFRWEVLLVGGVIAVLIVTSQILAAFIERGSL